MPIDELERDRLLADEATYQAAKTGHKEAVRSRETAIRRAHALGGSVREIADLLGVSFGLIGRIVRKERAA